MIAFSRTYLVAEGPAAAADVAVHLMAESRRRLRGMQVRLAQELQGLRLVVPVSLLRDHAYIDIYIFFEFLFYELCFLYEHKIYI